MEGQLLNASQNVVLVAAGTCGYWARLFKPAIDGVPFAPGRHRCSNSHFSGRSAPVLGRSNTGPAPIVQHLTGVADASGIAVAGDGHTPAQSDNRGTGELTASG
jgi:hypothetical protein